MIENAVTGDGNDTLIANASANELMGMRADEAVNIVQGGRGKDVIEGRRGADIIDGGEGIDILSYIDSVGGVQINLATNVVTGYDGAGDVITNAENVQGSRFGDILRGDAGANVPREEDGNDTIIGSTGNDTLYWRQRQ